MTYQGTHVNTDHDFDVAIIGAGPAGSVAAALLHQQGFRVCVLECAHFPRFVIGESLLPYSMDILAEADLLHIVQAQAGFQYKNGAAFTWRDRYAWFDFTDKFGDGPGTTFQVQRAVFDKLLIDEVARRGVTVHYGQRVTGYETFAAPDGQTLARLTVQTPEGERQLSARFVLDASGYGRVLSRLLGLERPSQLGPRQAIFTHIDDHIVGDEFDRNKILIGTHQDERSVWSWLIPFGNGRASLGVIASPDWLAARAKALPGMPVEAQHQALLRGVVAEIPGMARLLTQAVWDNGVPCGSIANYSVSVSTLVGSHFALLGNAAEFLDPVFSSGVTVALHSARLACRALARQLHGEQVDWQQAFVEPLKSGVDVFRAYVMGWYDGSFQDVVYCPPDKVNPEVKAMVSAILAGYAWDTRNPYVQRPAQRLRALAEICADNMQASSS